MSLTPESIVDILRIQTDDRLRNYMKYFEGDNKGNNLGFSLAHALYSNLDENQKTQFIDFIRNVQTDTMASVFDLLDNQAYPESQSKDIRVVEGDQILNGDLTDILFEKEEISASR